VFWDTETVMEVAYRGMHVSDPDIRVDLCSDLVPKITCQVGEPGLISRLWLRTPC